MSTGGTPPAAAAALATVPAAAGGTALAAGAAAPAAAPAPTTWDQLLTTIPVPEANSIAEKLIQDYGNAPTEEILALMDSVPTTVTAGTTGGELAGRYAAALAPEFFLVVDGENTIGVCHTLSHCAAMDPSSVRVVGLFNDRIGAIPPSVRRTAGQSGNQGAAFASTQGLKALPAATISTFLSSHPDTVLCDPDQHSAALVDTLLAFPLHPKWAWMFLVQAPMSPGDALTLGCALRDTVDATHQARADPLVDWLRAAATPCAAGLIPRSRCLGLSLQHPWWLR